MRIQFLYNNCNGNERKELKAKVGALLMGDAFLMVAPTRFRVNVSHVDPQATERGHRVGWPLTETVTVEWDPAENIFKEISA